MYEVGRKGGNKGSRAHEVRTEGRAELKDTRETVRHEGQDMERIRRV